MKIRNVTLARLCIKDGSGTCVCVELRRKPGPSHYQLVSKNVQADHEGLVQVYDILYGTRKCMAFCFELGEKAIFPFTDGKAIKFMVLSSQQKITEGRPTFNETFLFHWVEAARIDWRSLKSVAEPSMYLFYEDNENKVTINPVAMPDFRIEGLKRTSKLKMRYIPNKLNMTTPYERVSLISRDSNHGPSFCEATALSTKSTCRRKRQSKKINAHEKLQ